MRKYAIIVILVWVMSLVSFFIYRNMENRGSDYMIGVNRLHTQNTNSLRAGKEILPVKSGKVSSVNVIHWRELTFDQQTIFLTGTDIDKNRFVILPVMDTDYFIRYVIKPVHRNDIPIFVVMSLVPLICLGVLLHFHINIEKPLHEMAYIPEQLARGNLVYKTKQYKNKLFHDFLWGLDMLRVRLDEQKNINIQLEKERRTLVASLSHDIKTPLSSIINYGIAIEDGTYKTKAEINEAIQVLLDKAKKIQRLTDELLSASVNAIEGMEINTKEIYLEQICQAIQKTVANRLELLRMQFHMDIISEDLLVQADLDKLIEICDNITENAIKYGDLGYYTVQFTRQEQYILISFENTGVCIPESEIKYIFSSFYRGSNSEGIQGHGLGLYIVRNIMRAMGGDVYVENTHTGVKIVLVLRQEHS